MLKKKIRKLMFTINKLINNYPSKRECCRAAKSK